MSPRKLFTTIFLAVLAAIVLASGVMNYSSSHKMIAFRQMRDWEAFSVYTIKTPLHQSDARLYMIRLIREKDEEGHWDSQVAEDFDEGPDLFGFYDGNSETYRTQYIIVCINEKLETAEEVDEAGWDRYHDNSFYFDPGNGVPKLPQVLECP